jgi:poly(A) polymerase/tRNA nucleotidyltransferase (CCA-adding enzyme)
MLIPEFVLEVIKKVSTAGFTIELVGGCVRDLLMEKQPQDWDMATNARPAQILALFTEAKYENDFGTVLLPWRDSAGIVLGVAEITTYRSEKAYADRRHPDEVRFEDVLEKDLERRDFTVNAMALRLDEAGAYEFSGAKFSLFDLFGGVKDIRKKVIRAVGEPADRFKEDALRMMRAIRFCAQLGFSLEPKTQRGMIKLAGSLKFVAKERIRDEIIKIIISKQAAEGIMSLHESKLLQYIIPELEQGVGVNQNHHHIYPVFKHNVLSLKHCPSSEWPVRFASLLHDVAKPKTRRLVEGQVTFYNHEYVGAKMADRIMSRLRFRTEDRERVVNLVKNHMFYYNVGEVTAASVRRLISKVGRDNLQDLIHLRVADRLGSGTPKAMPYKLRHLQYMMEKVQYDPVSVKMLAINGHDLMSLCSLSPGPKIGAILDVLLGEVLEDPVRNESQYLVERAKILQSEDLADLRTRARDLIAEKRDDEDQDMQRRFKV